jgi:exonuclease III
MLGTVYYVPNKILRIAQWNANGLQQHKEELTVFLKQNLIDIMLISETHFTTKTYFYIPGYRLCHTNHPDVTAHGGTAILVKDTIMFYELLKYEEQAIQATSIKVQGILHEITKNTQNNTLKQNTQNETYISVKIHKIYLIKIKQKHTKYTNTHIIMQSRNTRILKMR